MRPVNRGNRPTEGDGSKLEFKRYQNARDSLRKRIGDYCSYCEICLHSRMDVEHIQPKSLRPSLELEWDNFLLACPICNAIKSDTNVDLDDYFWPDRDNTALVFLYDTDAPPRINPGLSRVHAEMAARSLDLTGLDRVPGQKKYSERDLRWLKRNEAWGIALLLHENLKSHDTPEMRNAIVLTAISRGFWSVWMQVFQDDIEMRKLLINGFLGTAAECFDNKTRPVRRRDGKV